MVGRSSKMVALLGTRLSRRTSICPSKKEFSRSKERAGFTISSATMKRESGHCLRSSITINTSQEPSRYPEIWLESDTN